MEVQAFSLKAVEAQQMASYLHKEKYRLKVIFLDVVFG
jgi:hypothetical protein